MAIYRIASRARMDTRQGRESIYDRLIHLLHHLEGLGVQLGAMTVRAGEVEINLSGDIPPRQALHLGLEKVA